MTMYVYCVYPAISKSPKQLPNCLKIAETSVVLIVFIGVICDKRYDCSGQSRDTDNNQEWTTQRH